MILYRGVRLGWVDPEFTGFVAAVNSHLRSGEIGIHWTTDQDVAMEFAAGASPVGHYDARRYAKDYPGKVHAGLVLIADIDEADLVGEGSWKHEKEKTVRKGAKIDIDGGYGVWYHAEDDDIDYMEIDFSLRATAAQGVTAGKVAPDVVELRAWYHGTSGDVSPGDILTGGNTAAWSPEGSADNDVVWISDNAWQASKYGSRTFQVFPKGEVQYRHKDNHEFWCETAEVWREVDRQTILDHANRLASKTASDVHPGARDSRNWRGIALHYVEQIRGGSDLSGIQATLTGREVGFLSWRDDVIDAVFVDEQFRRQGLASAMLAMAREYAPDLKHSTNLLDDGIEWARAVGSKTAAQKLYFHVSRNRIPLGTRLVPGGPGERSRVNKEYAQGNPDEQWRKSFIWVGEAPAAVDYAVMKDAEYIYLVRPEGVLTPRHHEAWTCDAATVVEAFPMKLSEYFAEYGHQWEYTRPGRRGFARGIVAALESWADEVQRGVWDGRTVASKTAALTGAKLWWRQHPEGRPFSPEDATSEAWAPGHQGAPTQGFSCFKDPWDLWVYLNVARRRGGDIIGFTGTQVGTGLDGEPTVVPDMQIVYRYSWDEFMVELEDTPRPQRPLSKTWEFWDQQIEWGNVYASRTASSQVEEALDWADEWVAHHWRGERRGEGACMAISAEVERRYGWKATEGVWFGDQDQDTAIRKGWVFTHFWNWLPNGDIFDGSAGQFFQSGPVARVVRQSSSDYDRYLQWGDMTQGMMDTLDDVVQGSYAGMMFGAARTAGRVQVGGDIPLRYDHPVSHRLSIHGEPSRAIQEWQEREKAKPKRFPGPPTGYAYFNPHGVDPAMNIMEPAPETLIAFADVSARREVVAINYVVVRPDHRGEGLARELVQAVYDEWPEATVYWGKLMAPEMGRLYDSFKEQYPERTGSASRMYSKTAMTWAIERFEMGGERFQMMGGNSQASIIREAEGQESWPKTICHLEWHPSTGEIAYVQTIPEYRRRGLATRLLAYARKWSPAIHHSEDLTEDGRAWSTVVGKTAMPSSWRSLTDELPWNDYQYVIVGEGGGSGRRAYEVYYEGRQVASRHSLADAKAAIEDAHGPQRWTQRRLSDFPVIHRYFGLTTEFTSPTTVWTADSDPAFTAAVGDPVETALAPQKG